MTLQIVLLMDFYHRVDLPLNVELCLNNTKSILEMDALPKEEIAEYLKNKGEKLTDEDVRGTSILFLVLLILGVICLAILIWQIWVYFKKRYPVKADKFKSFLSHAIFFNPMIRIFLMACLSLSLKSADGL